MEREDQWNLFVHDAGVRMTFEQIALILETPLGRCDEYADALVVSQRQRIVQIYNELKDRHSYSEASLQARVQWIGEAARALEPRIVSLIREVIREERAWYQEGTEV